MATTASRTAAAKDILRDLGGKAKKKTTKAKLPSRPTVIIPDNLHPTLTDFCAAKALGKEVESRIASEKDALTEKLYEIWTEALWNTKNRPANPTVETTRNGKTDCTVVFQVQDRISINPFPREEDQELEESFIEGFTLIFANEGASLSEAREMAEKLVAEELLLTPKIGVDLRKLLDGHWEGVAKNRQWVDASDEEIVLGNKVVALLSAREGDEVTLLNDEEMSQVIDHQDVMEVKKGFLDRLPNYVNSLDQLRAVLNIIRPVTSFHPVKFAVSDTPECRNKRLHAQAGSILGVTKE